MKLSGLFLIISAISFVVLVINWYTAPQDSEQILSNVPLMFVAFLMLISLSIAGMLSSSKRNVRIIPKSASYLVYAVISVTSGIMCWILLAFFEPFIFVVLSSLLAEALGVMFLVQANSRRKLEKNQPFVR